MAGECVHMVTSTESSCTSLEELVKTQEVCSGHGLVSQTEPRRRLDSSSGCSWKSWEVGKLESLGKCLEAAALQAGLTQGAKHLKQVEVKHHGNHFHSPTSPWSWDVPGCVSITVAPLPWSCEQFPNAFHLLMEWLKPRSG